MTSKAVTGSSAITSFGLQARAIAIITRWRMPPENSWGKSRRRSRLIPTSSRSSPTRFIASSSSTFSWRMIGSAICRPMLRTGLSEFIAPWKMIEMSFHRIRWIDSSDSLTRFRPLNRISPLTILPLYGSRRMTASAVVVLPQPLSPARVQDLIEGVSEQVEAEHEEDDAQTRDDEPPRVIEDRVVLDRLRDDASPAHGVGRPEAEERE